MNAIISHIEANSVVDGPGNRTVVFLQGCSIHCPGCQNSHLWDIKKGKSVEIETLAKTLATLSQKHGNVTISGGEPFNQISALAHLVRELRKNDVKNIIVYSGYKWEMITDPMNGHWLLCMDVLSHIDVLVDSPFINSKDHDLINWRGSSNQRPIDVPATLEAWTTRGMIVTHNWEQPVITVQSDGAAIMPIGLAPALAGLGKSETTRMCGETGGGIK